MFDLTAVLIIGFCVLGTYKLFELYAKRKERLLMIEKLSFLFENEEDKEKHLKIRVPFISGEDIDLGFWPLRISLLLIGIGAGCLLALFLQIFYFSSSSISTYRDWVRDFRELIVLANFASISFFGGIGLLTAFLIEQRKKARPKE